MHACEHTWKCLLVYKEDEINSYAQKTPLPWHNCSRQIVCHATLLRSDSSNNRQSARNILTMREWARNQRAVGSNPRSAGEQLEDKVEVKSSPFQQQPSNYHRPLSDALTSQLLQSSFSGTGEWGFEPSQDWAMPDIYKLWLCTGLESNFISAIAHAVQCLTLLLLYASSLPNIFITKYVLFSF